MAITKEQVFETADSLSAAGTDPTYLQVRTHLGSGSFSTIQKYLRQWKDARPDTGSTSPEGDLPEPLIMAARGFARDAWRIAQSMTARQSSMIREELERQHQSTRQDLEAAARMVDALQVTLEETERRRLDDRGEMEQLREEFASSQRARVAAETAREHLEKEQSRIGQQLGLVQRELAEKGQSVALLSASFDEAKKMHSQQMARLEEALEKKEQECLTERARSEELNRSLMSTQLEREALARELFLIKEQLLCEQGRYQGLLETVQRLSVCLGSERLANTPSTAAESSSMTESSAAAHLSEFTTTATDPVLRVVGDSMER